MQTTSNQPADASQAPAASGNPTTTKTAPPAVDRSTVAAMLQRGRVRMVQAVLNEGGLVNAQRMYDYWQGFASCAASLLTGAADVMALHDQASDLDSVSQAALARLPEHSEWLSFAKMKGLVKTEGVDLAADLVAHSDVNTVAQLQDGMRTAIKLNDKHAVAGVDVQDGGQVHCGASPVVDASILPPAIGQYWPAQGGIYLGIAEAEPASGPADCATPALPRRHVVMLHGVNTPAGDDGADTIKCWDKAAGWAAAQGNGARLPTRIEAIMAHQCEAARATFDKDSYYWTCTQSVRHFAFCQSLGFGSSLWYGKDYEVRCRAFRGLALEHFNPSTLDAVSDRSQSAAPVVQVSNESAEPAAPAAQTPPAPGQHWPAQGGTYIGIAPAEGDLPARHLVALDLPAGEEDKELTWQDACAWATAQGNGARLPTQLEALFAYTVAKAAFKPRLHWTGTQGDRHYAFAQSVDGGSSYWLDKDHELRCRAFRGLALQTFSPLQG